MNETMKPDQTAEATALRQRAEEQLQRRTPSDTAPLSAAETRRLLHQLQVHQIELEIQNEELRSSRAQLETAVADYTDLYDFAPAGYFTLDRDGNITQTNLAGASLLGLERGKLSGKRFGVFVAEADLQVFSVFLQHVFTKQHHTHCEVALELHGRPSITAQIEALLSPNERECRAVVLDITEV
jgi:PAS domain S-box-containing protein